MLKKTRLSVAITNTPIEVIVKYKGFSLFPNTINKISNATLGLRRISSSIVIKFQCHLIYQIIHVKQNYVHTQTGLIFISDFVADKSGSWRSHFSHLRAFFCLHLPFRLELPQVLSVGYHQAPKSRAQFCLETSLSTVENGALLFLSKESSAFPLEKEEKQQY